MTRKPQPDEVSPTNHNQKPPSRAVIAGRVRGAGHERTGQPCQDFYFYQWDRDWAVACLADGAGSARFAHIGARRAVFAAGTLAVNALRRGTTDLTQCTKDALAAARLALEQQPAPISDYACTLLLVVQQGDRLATAQIGDGWIVLLRGQSSKAAHLPSRGQYVNQTNFLTQTTWCSHVQYQNHEQLPALNGFALLSDGLERATISLQDATPSHTFFNGLYGWLTKAETTPKQAKKALLTFLNSDRVRETSDDDKSMVLITRCHSGEATEPIPSKLVQPC
ncbi:PP2C family serine/threonine-protein phosphatase [Acanthopleuribacter pedis]|uniref:Protein phosphatase 2C domain-containing protein n=1 Tax=Acanthopleuribacter pedis TaxID=442870 RepID=A0A8J7Q795_9BACT|nr:PP2C family serine/threonine-protein phosphatase [Acanthopleuribacter pedis]MBO1321937.1 protein phosphatase 2C domain-containing protein [Acanthopleuribacter pedis]